MVKGAIAAMGLVSEQLKGASGSSLDVVVPGGTANNLRQIYSGAPQLNVGGEFVLFLWTGPSGLNQIMGLTQGLFRLSPGASSSVVTRAASTELSACLISLMARACDIRLSVMGQRYSRRPARSNVMWTPRPAWTGTG